MFGRKTYITAAFALLTAVSGLWQSRDVYAYQIGGPSLGYITDAITSTVRIIDGIPGASALGRPVSLDVRIRRAQVSVKGDYALAVRDDDGQVVLLSALSGVTSVSPVPGIVNGGDALGLSPNEASAVTYSVSGSRIQVIAGLPARPELRFEIDTANTGQALTAVGVNNNQQVLAAFSNGGNGALYMFAADTAPRLISTVGLVSGIAFAANGDRAVITDRAWNQVVLFEDLSSAATPVRIAGTVDGISGPIGVLLSRDANRAYVANDGSGTVTVLNLAGGAARDVPCRCLPTTMRPLRGDLIFALTERTNEPIVVFDAQSGEPRVLMVPADLLPPDTPFIF